MKITCKLEKQEKRLKEEKQHLAVLALASPQTSSSTLKQREEVQEKPKKKKKQNAQEVPQENKMEKLKEQLVNGDLEETEHNASSPKSKKSWEEAVVNNAAEVGSREVSSKEQQPQRGCWQQ